MENYEKDLDTIALNLKNAADVLACFLSFCDEEGNMDENQSYEETKIKAYCFLIRLQSHKALTELALDTVKREKDILYALFDEQEAALHNG